MTTSATNSMRFSKRRKYGVIYADPPWSFRNWSAKGTGRNAISHYDCLDFHALAALPVADLARDKCVLFLWATDPLLHRAFELIRAWGFEYKTVAFYWAKLNAKPKHEADFFTGLGYWTRANPEQCLLATRGKPTRLAKDVRRLVIEKRREHSRKPDCVRDRIERLVAGPYLELFARETKRGWDCWGDQAGLFNQGTVAARRQRSRLVDAAELLFSQVKPPGSPPQKTWMERGHPHSNIEADFGRELAPITANHSLRHPTLAKQF